MNAVNPTSMLSYAPEIQAKATTKLAAQKAAFPQGVSFSDRLAGAIQAVDHKQVDADNQLQAVAAGKDVDLHAAMIALEEADISLRAMTSFRDKAVESYERIMNMSI